MYQHPSKRETYKFFGEDHIAMLEEGWLQYKSGTGRDWIQIMIPDDEGGEAPAVISFKTPMTQLSPRTNISRKLLRFIQEE